MRVGDDFGLPYYHDDDGARELSIREWEENGEREMGNRRKMEREFTAVKRFYGVRGMNGRAFSFGARDGPVWRAGGVEGWASNFCAFSPCRVVFFF